MTDARTPGAVAGGVAAAAALAAGQLPSAIAGETGSLVSAVGDEFVDRFAGSLKDVAVALFGTNDKTALLVGIVVTSILVGAALGIVAVHRRGVAAGGLAAFGAVGLVSGLSSPQTSAAVAAISAIAAVGTGIGVLFRLLSIGLPASSTDGEGAKVRVLDRRAFLVWTGGMGLAAVAAAGTSNLLRSRTITGARRSEVVLPQPVLRTPATASATFDRPGLSPYITPNGEFFRIDTALTTPRVDPDSWRLRVAGEVDRPFELTYDELLAMATIAEPVTIACVSNEVGGGLVGNAVWQGVPLAALLDRAGVRPRGTQVVGRAVDGFTVGFPTDVAVDGRVAMVAVGMNGEPLPFDHGFPARLVVAGLYGYVSATKWLSEIELTAFDDFDAYWVPRGWAKEAPVKTQSRIDLPRAGARLPRGPTVVAGVAWAPTRGIDRVEVQVDDAPWVDADLGGVASDNTWVQWATTWQATPGRHVLRVRATDGAGTAQTSDVAPPRPDGATGWHQRSVLIES